LDDRPHLKGRDGDQRGHAHRQEQSQRDIGQSRERSKVVHGDENGRDDCGTQQSEGDTTTALRGG
jgi:hypothetical protein